MKKDLIFDENYPPALTKKEIRELKKKGILPLKPFTSMVLPAVKIDRRTKAWKRLQKCDLREILSDNCMKAEAPGWT